MKIRKILLTSIFIFVAIACLACVYGCVQSNKNARYIISFNTDGGSEVDSIILNAGDSIVLPDAPVKEGYVFLGWFSDRACTREVNVNLFKARSNMTIFAGWESVETYKHAITIASSSQGKIMLYEPGEPKASMGTEVSVRVVANADYEVSRVYAVGNNDGETIEAKPDSAGTIFSFEMPKEPVTVYVDFALKTFTVSISSDTENGTVILSTAAAKRGETVLLQYIAAFGYKFKAAYVTYSNVVNAPIENGSFVMPADNVSVKAVFEKIDSSTVYSVTTSFETGGVLKAYSEYAAEGEYVYYSVDSDDGYLLEKVTLSYGGEEFILEERYFLMPASDVVIKAYFCMPDGEERYYTVEISGNNFGSVFLEAEDNKFAAGEKVELIISPAPGYEAAGISVNGVYAEGTSFFMPECDVVVAADFRFKGYSVSFAEQYSGYSVTGAPEYALPGSRVTFDVAPFGNVAVNSVTVLYGNDEEEHEIVPVQGCLYRYSFIMGSDNAVITVYTAGSNKKYAVTIALTEGGSVTANGVSEAAAGNVVGLTFSPDDGYRLKEDGFIAEYTDEKGETHKALSASGSFIMPAYDVIVYAEFEKVYDVIAYIGDDLNVLPSVSQAAPGETVTFTVVAHDDDIVADSMFVSLTVSGKNVDIGNALVYVLPPIDASVPAVVYINKPEYTELNTANSYYLYLESGAGGSVSANFSSGARVPEGEEIYLSVSADDGYVPAGFTLEYEGRSESVSDVFIMPYAPIGATLRARFEERPASNLTPEGIYELRRDEFFEAGFVLEYFKSASGLSALWNKYPLLGYVTGVLKVRSGYGFDFVVLHVDTLKKAAPIASTAYKILSSENPQCDVDVYIDHNSIVLALNGDASEAYQMLLNGVTVYGDMILYRRADFSYGLYALTAPAEYFTCPSNVNGRAVTYIARGAFAAAGTLKSMALNTVEEIGDFAFEGLEYLGEIDLGMVSKIGKGAFKGCSSLKRFYVSAKNEYFMTDSVGALYAYLSGSSKQLTAYPANSVSVSSYTLYSGTVSIAEYAFYGAKYLINLSYLSTLTEIGDYAFLGAENLSMIYYSNVTGGLANGTADFSQSHSKVTRIGASAFSGTALRIFRLGNVLYLGAGAIEWDGVKDVVVYLNTSEVTAGSGEPIALPDSIDGGTLKVVTGALFNDYRCSETFSYLGSYLKDSI